MATGTNIEQTVESDKKQAILYAALELFAVNGFSATPVPKIAEKAAVGAGTIYRYFESKEELLNALYRQWKGTLFDYLNADFPAGESPEKKFRHLYRGMVRFENDHPLAFAFLEFHHHEPNLDKESQCVEHEIYEFIYGFIIEAIESGAIKNLHRDSIVALVFGSFTALVKARQAGQLNFDDELLRNMEDCCWEAIRAG